MKTFTKFAHPAGVGKYSLRDILDSLSTVEIEELIQDYAKEIATSYGQALLQKASEKATLIINEYRLVKGETDARFFPFKIGNTYSINDGCFIEIDKDSILNVTLKLI